MTARRRSAFPLAAMLLLAASLADPAVRAGTPRRCRILVVDASGSVRPFTAERDARARAALADLGPDDLAGWVAFGERAEAGAAPAPAGTAPLRGLDPPAGLGEDGSRPDLAIDLARTLVPPDTKGELVLLSDGRATGGDVARAVLRAAESGVTVHAAPLGSGRFLDVAVASVRGPSAIPVRAAIDLAAVITATARCVAEVQWRVGGRPALTTRLEFDGPGARETRLRLPPSEERELDVRCAVSVEGEDPRLAVNDEAGLWVARSGTRRVAVLGRREGSRSARAWLAALPDVALVDVAGGPTGLDALVLEDVPYEELGPEKSALLRAWIASGAGGLLVLGGRSSFAAGGYAGTPLEALLPLLSSPRETLAVVLCIDQSGSMDEPGLPGLTKLESSIQSMLAALGRLDGEDQVGVLAFHRLAEIVWPLGRFAGTEGMEDSLRRLRARGETRILPTVQEAERMLAGAQGRKHILLLSDGQTAEAPSEFSRAAKRLAAGGITLTAIAVGAAVGPEDLAKLQALSSAIAGGGRTIQLQEMAGLEAALEEDLKRQKGAFHDAPAAVSAAPGSPWAAGLGDPGAIGGYVRTRAREEARTDLAAAGGDPIAASWELGLGRVAAIATDPAGEWCAGWRTSGTAPAIVSAALHWVLPRPEGGGVRLSASLDGGDAVLEVSPAEGGGGARDLLGLRARLLAPGSTEPREVPLEAETPGLWRARAPVTVPGVYRWTVVRGDAAAGSAAVFGSYGREWLGVGADLATLADLAALGRGSLILTPKSPPPTAGAPEARVPLRRWLQGAAGLLLFVPPIAAWWRRRKTG